MEAEKEHSSSLREELEVVLPPLRQKIEEEKVIITSLSQDKLEVETRFNQERERTMELEAELGAERVKTAEQVGLVDECHEKIKQLEAGDMKKNALSEEEERKRREELARNRAEIDTFLKRTQALTDEIKKKVPQISLIMTPN